jgi:hypothetical protein
MIWLLPFKEISDKGLFFKGINNNGGGGIRSMLMNLPVLLNGEVALNF